MTELHKRFKIIKLKLTFQKGDNNHQQSVERIRPHVKQPTNLLAGRRRLMDPDNMMMLV